MGTSLRLLRTSPGAGPKTRQGSTAERTGPHVSVPARSLLSVLAASCRRREGVVEKPFKCPPGTVKDPFPCSFVP